MDAAYESTILCDNTQKGNFSVELSPKSNSLRFTFNCTGFVYAYVLGDFNGWRKSDKYKLTWNIDIRDGQIKLIKDVALTNRINNGLCRFSFILIDIEGNETPVNRWTDSNAQFYFDWHNYETNIRIITSNDYVSVECPVEIVGITERLYGNISFDDLKWSLCEELAGVTIENGFLRVDKNVPIGTKFKIKAILEKEAICAEKEITVSDVCEPLIHYYRTDDCYEGINYKWNLWGYDDNNYGEEKELTINTDFGKAAYCGYNKFIIKKKQWGEDWCNNWVEQSQTENNNNPTNNIYMISDDNKCFWSLKEALIAVMPRIKYAYLDDGIRIKAELSHRPLIGNSFRLYINKKQVNDVEVIVKKDKKQLIITDLPDNIKANDLVEIRAAHMFTPYIVKMRNYLDKFYYKGDDMGIHFINNKISLKVWAPTAFKAEVLIYHEWECPKDEPAKIYEMIYDSKTGTYSCRINKFRNENKFYLYRFYFYDISPMGKRTSRITYAVDPYAVAVGINGDKGALVDLGGRKVKPRGWGNDKTPILQSKEDSIIYELHIRDFTIDESSGVLSKHRGTYLGAVEEGTFYKSADNSITVRTGLDHLKELGITHVHLMPVFDFGSVNEMNKDDRNWGYDPKNFNCPEGSYSTDPFNPIVRIKEFRQMVAGFHRNGIRVVMDMVYNHMMDTTNLNNIVPKYYFRTDENGKFTNGSGCGNEMATEKPMVRKFIVDSCVHWVKDYNIDGLRFDLMELIDYKTMREITKRCSVLKDNFLIYGEPWTGGPSSVKNGTYKGRQKGQNFSIFNDTFRNGIRGDNSPNKGFINGDCSNRDKAWTIVEGLKGSIFTSSYLPMESINYSDAHDNYTLWDQIIKSQNNVSDNSIYRNIIQDHLMNNKFVKEDLLAAAIVLFAQGIPFIQEGSEILRTKMGDGNSYRSGDKINALKWDDKVQFIEVFNFYKELISIRKSFSELKMKKPEEIKRDLNIYFPNNNDKSGVIFCHYLSGDNNNSYKEILVVYNGSEMDNYDIRPFVTKPANGMWKILVLNDKADSKVIYTTEHNTLPLVNAHSVLFMYS